MKVLFDHQIFSWQKYGGISRYFYELMRNFSEDIVFSNSTVFSDNFYIHQNKDIVSHASFLTEKDLEWKKQIYLKSNKLNSILKLRLNDFDIFHPTYYDPYFLQHIGKKPFFLTVHDMIHEKHPNCFAENDLIRNYKKELIKKAAKIIAVSENTKADIVELYNYNPSNIEVVYHGFELSRHSNVTTKLSIPPKYVLFVGERAAYKNFSSFVKALSELMQKDDQLNLVCTGKDFNNDETTLLNKLGILSRTFVLQPDDNELSVLYQKALAFVFPSYYEGFGIPILEAFSNNCPVILSSASSFPEVAQDAAFYFDPFDVDSIQHSIDKVIYNADLRKELQQRGQERYKMFSWKTAAKKTELVYKTI